MDVRKRSASRRFSPALLIFMAGVGAAVAAPGDLDLTFSDDGVLFINGLGGEDEARALLPTPDGGVLVAGQIDNGVPFGFDFSVVKLEANGLPDGGFGANGVASVDLGSIDYANDVLRLPDGRIVAAGALRTTAYTDMALVRFTAQGQLDTTFGEANGAGARRGYVRLNVGPVAAINDEAISVARQSDGKLVIAGIGFVHDGAFDYRRFALARFSEDGVLDTTFGGQGTGVVIAAPTQAQATEYVTGIAKRADGSLPPDDKITVVGYVFNPGKGLIRRFNANGTPDPSLDGDGTLVIEDTLENGQGTGLRSVEAAVLQSNGRIAVVGRARDRGFTFMRFEHGGARDASFGVDGRRLVKFSSVTDYDEPAALTLAANGNLIAAGYFTATYDGTAGSDFGVAQLLPNGTPDPAFGDGEGRSTYPLVMDSDEARAVTVTTRGMVIAAGRAARPGNPNLQDDMALLGLQGDASIFRDGFE